MKSILFFLLLPLIATTAQTDAPTRKPTRAPKPPTNAPAVGAAAPPTLRPTTSAPIAPIEPGTSPPTTHRPTHRKNLGPTPEPTPTRGGADDDFGQDINLKDHKDPNAVDKSFVTPTSTASTGLSAGGKAGIAITFLVLVGGLVGFFLWKRKSGKAAPRAVEVGVLDADGSSLAAGNGTVEGDSVDVDLSDDKVEDAAGGDAGSRIIL